MKETILFILIFLFSACEMLDIEPALSVSQEKAIENESDLKKAITGTYDALQGSGLYGRQMVIIPGLLTNSLQWGGTTQEYGEFDFNQVSAENFILASIWSSNYDAINRANYVLGRLPELGDISAERGAIYEAELRFLRGLAYFNLVRLFGGVPLREQATLDAGASSLDLARADRIRVWNFIQSDFEYAAQNLLGNNAALANADAAKGFLCKVHLWKKEYDAALAYADEIIANTNYELEINYADLFVDANNKEGLFYIDFNEQDQNTIAQYFKTRKEVLPTTDLQLSFEAGDTREPVCIDDKNLVNKYTDITTGSDKVYVLRLADIYLLRAEAEALRAGGDINLALNDLNEIRARAGVVDTDYSTKSDLLDGILNERRIELCFEGQYWFDLLRTGKAQEYLSNVSSADQLLMPIPLEEINSNGAIGTGDQNPGY